MFYLRFVLLLLKRFPVRTFYLYLSTFLLMFYIQNFDYLKTNLTKFLPRTDFDHYLWIYGPKVEGFDGQWWREHLSKNPVITKWDILEGKELKDKVLGKMKELNLESKESDVSLGQAVKIYFDPQIRNKSQLVNVKNYLLAITKNQFVFGPFVLPNLDQLNRGKIWDELIEKWGPGFLLIFFMVFWFGSLFMVLSPLEELSSLIELYQRRKYVQIKVLLFLFFICSWSFVPLTLGISWSIGAFHWGDFFLGPFIIVLFTILLKLKNPAAHQMVKGAF
jgi:hypothetical protein